MMSRVPPFPSLLAVALLATLACAGAAHDPADAAAPAAPAASAAEPPQIMRGTAPQLRIPASTSSRSTVRVQIEVMIDEMGRPDMTTFKATGPGADVNRDALRTWIEGASFRPARLDGRAIPGLFRMGLDASVRRM